ncbi:hypothetical protein CSX00_10940 [Pseudobutyrivibrio ruminis]|uniref:Uncharacterized protein n=1 Tax=Pseudobutyrivibrio ruminis TaxID=46206 RepID=A0A2G3E8A7_9FIRM|nr:hypothetical protein [Pseudobutyrivibrio ruminis]PHU39522.1 hypothetical protein CSX00_10940 [Pseudobutyrivibrio ruminis]
MELTKEQFEGIYKRKSKVLCFLGIVNFVLGTVVLAFALLLGLTEGLKIVTWIFELLLVLLLYLFGTKFWRIGKRPSVFEYQEGKYTLAAPGLFIWGIFSWLVAVFEAFCAWAIAYDPSDMEFLLFMMGFHIFMMLMATYFFGMARYHFSVYRPGRTIHSSFRNIIKVIEYDGLEAYKYEVKDDQTQ